MLSRTRSSKRRTQVNDHSTESETLDEEQTQNRCEDDGFHDTKAPLPLCINQPSLYKVWASKDTLARCRNRRPLLFLSLVLGWDD